MSEPTAPAAAPLRILWADDDEVVRRLGSVLLGGAGHRVTVVKDGGEAIARLTTAPDDWDVLITDHDMPLIDGLALVRELPRLRFAGRVLVVSGSINDALEELYRQCGVAAILSKPLDRKRLLSALTGTECG